MKPQKQRDNKERLEFMSGYAVAIGQLVALYDQPTVAKHMMRAVGLTPADFKGIEPYDMKWIKKAWKS